jgi:hypothetical protein
VKKWLWIAACAAGATACKPPAVEALDQWLIAYEQDDVERVVDRTWSGDRELMRAAMIELRTAATGTLAIALPPRPQSHELIEVDSKSDDGERWVVLVKTTLKNPLPFASERVGHVLENMPKTREQRRKYLMIREGERWGVKLDLAPTIERAKFVTKFQRALSRRDFSGAEEMLANIPPPPDEANAQKTKDRLAESLKAELEKAKKL